ncbi:putative tRNA-dihydrouridine synthase [Bdellovibrio bacteriovorus]|uniref:tRNA dihydrouridine synthase n=1 Tax=Bdellovibrio bacteriovorus TaxID=959 RepID=UPI00045C1913|nr:tRNA-dihydrouridine synthase family protein [Bdellovibrio bacteriovorus]AHZ86515.1 nitrogen fixation protein NifR [Bdellovibrio bacteriovorus]BEV67758.1 putative tRNA-dihydrouridine synthase [Bdellovibrio bacteriovorus]
MKLGLHRPVLDGKVNFPLCLAPMVGLTHVALREVMRDYLPAEAYTIWPTEMLNSRRIPGENLEKTPETMRAAYEPGLVPQILGNEEDAIAESVKRLVEWGAEAIDINMGCPVQKALKHNYGVALMGDPAYAAEVVRMTVKNSTVPVSVKLRAVGSTKEFDELLTFVSGLRQSGAAWVCLHPRTAAQKRRGNADWEQIKQLHRAVDFPVIGNGDVQTYDDAINMLKETGCDMAMAGRGLAARPWMMWQLGEELGFAPPAGKEGQKAPRTSEEEGAEYGKCLLRLIDRCRFYFGEDLAMRKVRFYVRTTSVWLPFGNTLVGVCAKARTIDEMIEGVTKFFEGPVEMSLRTELRQ